MLERERIINDYFQSWLDKDSKILREVFESDIVYSECYGPEYHGIDSIYRWFDDWNQRGTVLVWDVKQFIHQSSRTVVEWYFKCEYDGKVGEFDGVSLIVFNDDNRIVNLKEFQSEIPHYFPYK